MPENYNKAVVLITLLQIIIIIFGFLFCWIMLRGMSENDESVLPLTIHFFSYGLYYLGIPLSWSAASVVFHGMDRCPEKTDLIMFISGVITTLLLGGFVVYIFVGSLLHASSVSHMIPVL